jgi:hypothetical protein
MPIDLGFHLAAHRKDLQRESISAVKPGTSVGGEDRLRSAEATDSVEGTPRLAVSRVIVCAPAGT